ncbi:helix-turn-helix transcriptional regulator [Streptomyces sp. SCA3-4]|uniref:helix-turn-helix domain-containing protein n=1 Tax=Streptomyces sichuanensis TaxID=2871810 RepID=UPI001CE251B9|nr:helix-turn-helix transcriptional regulator [Streptomyces sichuanensis]MCA6094475.1 helix-turn-helix transcriptional regulator [Streptomyces sichuanensis]
MAWRLCGNQVKLWRMDAGVSREALGQEAGYGYETVKSMEQGRRRPSQRLLEVADEMCGANGKLLAARNYLQPERFVPRVRDYMAAEAEAIAVHWYETVLIPGLLQTEEYARVLMAQHCPPVDDETVEERVAARLERQGLLTKATVLFSFVLYEAALHTLVGGREAMRRQLDHLLEVGNARNVSLQVLPARQGVYAGLGGPFVLLENAELERHAFEEGQETGVLHTDPERISNLTKRHAMIRMQALSAEESAEFIRKLAEE